MMQTAYELRVGDKEIQKGKNITWSSDKVLSGQSLYIPYEGKQVESGKRYNMGQRQSPIWPISIYPL